MWWPRPSAASWSDRARQPRQLIGTLAAFVLVSIGVSSCSGGPSPDLHRTFRVPLMPVLPIPLGDLCFAVALFLPGSTWLQFILWMIIGFDRLLPLRPPAQPGADRRQGLTDPTRRRRRRLGCPGRRRRHHACNPSRSGSTAH
ncbi:hypothetical protein HBB16_01750 [Pseudonocardia sp. MCCB 268]|nr:hypothetical protein [Pseudonocardia cytotoxica]